GPRRHRRDAAILFRAHAAHGGLRATQALKSARMRRAAPRNAPTLPAPAAPGTRAGSAHRPRHRREGRRDAGRAHAPRHSGSGSELVHLISSRQTLERTLLTPGRRISFSIRKTDNDFRSCATTLTT